MAQPLSDIDKARILCGLAESAAAFRLRRALKSDSISVEQQTFRLFNDGSSLWEKRSDASMARLFDHQTVDLSQVIGKATDYLTELGVKVDVFVAQAWTPAWSPLVSSRWLQQMPAWSPPASSHSLWNHFFFVVDG